MVFPFPTFSDGSLSWLFCCYFGNNIACNICAAEVSTIILHVNADHLFSGL